jgi:putative PIN family toxin of toxin-antitoxin system
MRVCIDTNLLISFLLNPFSVKPPARIVRAAFDGEISLVIVDTTLQELNDKVRNKPWLAQRIPGEAEAELAARLTSMAHIIPSPERIPAVTRDRRDDYMLVPVMLGAVDYVVSGDKDLLVLGEHAGVRIVSPAAFVAILDGSSPTMEPR